MSYTPRTSAPSSGDPYWTKTTYGGYNEQILGNSVNRPWSGSVLPNCTGYVHGRWMELANQHYDFDQSILPWGNASTYYVNSSVEKGQDPRLGACMVWGRGAGHVCIVEEIIDNDTVVTSESDWGSSSAGGTVFVTRTRRRGWNWGYYSGYTRPFLGFLYHPNISPPTPPAPPKYNLTVVNGRADLYVEEAGTVTNIYADPPSTGLKFYKWIASTTNGTIANPNIMNTTFTFGNGDNTITALYKKRDSLSLMYYISPISLRRRM